jgi:hypothetical protein
MALAQSLEAAVEYLLSMERVELHLLGEVGVALGVVSRCSCHENLPKRWTGGHATKQETGNEGEKRTKTHCLAVAFLNRSHTMRSFTRSA